MAARELREGLEAAADNEEGKERKGWLYWVDGWETGSESVCSVAVAVVRLLPRAVSTRKGQRGVGRESMGGRKGFRLRSNVNTHLRRRTRTDSNT